jgi:hypothetical protein
MDNLLMVAFEAHIAVLNHHRRYQITLGRVCSTTGPFPSVTAGRAREARRSASPARKTTRCGQSSGNDYGVG